jgi:hypothetical protein
MSEQTEALLERAYDLVLPSLQDGSPRSLSDFLGRKVILHVFASW